MRRPSVLGLDLSSTSTGACYDDGTSSTIAPPKNLDLLRRAQWTSDIVLAHDPAETVVVEAIGTRHVNTAIALATVHALVLSGLSMFDHVNVVKVAPTKLKKWATGKGAGAGTDKVGMARTAQAAGWDAPMTAGDDEADAWWLWTIGCALHDDWQVPRTKYREEILDDLRAGK